LFLLADSTDRLDTSDKAVFLKPSDSNPLVVELVVTAATTGLGGFNSAYSIYTTIIVIAASNTS
jgi:hypothetical protein